MLVTSELVIQVTRLPSPLFLPGPRKPDQSCRVPSAARQLAGIMCEFWPAKPDQPCRVPRAMTEIEELPRGTRHD
jgi:hypothetical protein